MLVHLEEHYDGSQDVYVRLAKIEVVIKAALKDHWYQF